MRKYFLHSFANLKKGKANSISLFIMFLISGFLLSVGLLMLIGFGSFFNSLIKQLNPADSLYIMQKELYTSDVEDFLSDHGSITETDREFTIMHRADILFGGKKEEKNLLFRNASAKRNISKWKTVGKSYKLESNSVYIPNIYKKRYGYSLNDQFKFSIGNNEYSFEIKGFSEDIFFSSDNTKLVGVYLTNDDFSRISEDIGTSGEVTLIHTKLKNIDSDLLIDIQEKINLDYDINYESSLRSIDLDMANSARTVVVDILSVITIVFSILVVVVGLMVIRFSIKNSIEDDMEKIGVLKALGYVNKQIVTIIILQYLILAIVASSLGVVASYRVIPWLSNLFAKQSGLLWEQQFSVMITLLSLGIISFLVIGISLASTGRINKLYPIAALKGGKMVSNFNKNWIPLSKFKGFLPMLLALKFFMQNMKQNIMLMLIFFGVSFAAVFSLVMFYNSTIDTTAFIESSGVELSNVRLELSPNSDSESIIQVVQKLNDVRKAQFIDTSNIKIDDKTIEIYVMDDYKNKESNFIVEGRYPEVSDEIAIAGQVGAMLGKGVGNKVTLTGDLRKKYTITGLTQGAQMNGMIASIRTDGITKILPDFNQSAIHIYLKEGVKNSTFIEEVEDLLGDSLLYAVNIDKLINDEVGPFKEIVKSFGFSMIVVAMLILTFVLYFVINSYIIRRKVELGIQKAIGYTTVQLMSQVMLGFIPSLVIGTISGCLLALAWLNPMLSIVMRQIGSMRANFLINPHWTLLLCLIIILFSFCIVLIITLRIRKISAYALITE